MAKVVQIVSSEEKGIAVFITDEGDMVPFSNLVLKAPVYDVVLAALSLDVPNELESIPPQALHMLIQSKDCVTTNL